MTTAAAKLAAHLRLQVGFRVGLLAEDRSGRGVEPLREFSELLGAPFRAARSPQAAALALDRMRSLPLDVVIFDAEGVEPDLPRVGRESSKWLEAAGVAETHLAIRCDEPPDRLDDAARIFAPLGADRALLTRGDRVGLGIDVPSRSETESATQTKGWPEGLAAWLNRGRWRLSYLSFGPEPPNDLASFDRADHSEQRR